jgi:5'-methylthioadenosine phosphorylase
LKSVGVRRVISVTASGSLREGIAPGDLVLPSQYFDWTPGKRASSFFGEGMVGHVSTAEPVCPKLSRGIAAAARRSGTKVHEDKIYACVEGPRLGTRAESFFLRSAGCDIVGMTNVPEAFLAREAQLCYATLAIATDYDCWMEDPSQHASSDQVVALYMRNLSRVQELLRATVLAEGESGGARGCSCGKSLQGALMSPREKLGPAQRELLAFLES